MASPAPLGHDKAPRPLQDLLSLPTLRIYPRYAMPDRLLMVTRRTLYRRFRMIPKKRIRGIQKYIMTRAALEAKIEIHQYVFLGNHYHILLTDNPLFSTVSEFLERMNRWLARVLNSIQGTRGYFWDSEPSHIVEALDREAAEALMVYIALNAQRAGLASGPGGWIGLESLIADVGTEPEDVPRPSDLGPHLPPLLKLELTKPKFFEDLSIEEFRAEMTARIRAASLELRRQRGRRTLSVGAILSTDPLATPRETAEEEAERHRDRTNRPFRGAPQLCREAELAMAGFQDAYRAARDPWSRGDHTVTFPPGTYALVRHHGARTTRAA